MNLKLNEIKERLQALADSHETSAEAIKDKLKVLVGE